MIEMWGKGRGGGLNGVELGNSCLEFTFHPKCMGKPCGV